MGLVEIRRQVEKEWKAMMEFDCLRGWERS